MSWLRKIATWVKSHIIISIIIIVFIVGGIMATIIIVSNINKKNKQEYNTNIELKDNLSFEINSELYLISLIKKISNGELISENYKVDTAKLGTQEIAIKYLDEKQKEKEYRFNIDIVDTIKPTIEYNKELFTTSGKNIELLKDVKVTDNSNEEIKATVDGKYDFNKVGTYNLKYIAVDSSNNKTEEEFTLIIKNITLKTNGYYIATSGEYGYGSIKFYSGNKFNWWAAFGDYGAVAAYEGTYKINGDKLTFNATKSMSMQGWTTNKETFDLTIINENTVKYNGYTYKWQSTSNLSAKHPKSL